MGDAADLVRTQAIEGPVGVVGQVEPPPVVFARASPRDASKSAPYTVGQEAVRSASGRWRRGCSPAGRSASNASGTRRRATPGSATRRARRAPGGRWGARSSRRLPERRSEKRVVLPRCTLCAHGSPSSWVRRPGSAARPHGIEALGSGADEFEHLLGLHGHLLVWAIPSAPVYAAASRLFAQVRGRGIRRSPYPDSCTARVLLTARIVLLDPVVGPGLSTYCGSG